MRRVVGRLAALTAGVFITLLILLNTFETRKTAYSCRTLSSCLGFKWRSKPVSSLKGGDGPLESEAVLKDGSVRFDRVFAGASPELLVLVLSRDATSWSSDFRSEQRTVYDFLDILAATRLDLATVSLGLMTASTEEYAMFKDTVRRLNLARTTVLLRPDTDNEVSYAERHNNSPELQLSRRSNLAQLRNHLMSRALEDERHVLWIDADVAELSPGIVQTMIERSDTNPDAGIITARCGQASMSNYDKNAWKVNSKELMGVIADKDRDRALTKLVETRVYVPQLIQGTGDGSIVALDSVGGTILFMRAELIRQGLTFPTYNLLGTTWTQHGWIGVETEGLCYAARSLKGGGCFVLGGRHHVRHTDQG